MDLDSPEQAGYDVLAVIHAVSPDVEIFSRESSKVSKGSALGEMSLVVLAECCAEEIGRYRRNEPSDGCYGLEIFRRAVVLGDEDAWCSLQGLFNGVVHYWFSRYTYRETALRHESEQDYVDHAFQRFWQAVRSQGFGFTSLSGALHYLRLCLYCAVKDTLRMYARISLEVLPEQGAPDEPQVEDRYDECEVWEAIGGLLANERERRVAFLHFHCNLKAREIMRYCPGEFVSETEIYQLKRNVWERIMRNVDKIRWRLGDVHS